MIKRFARDVVIGMPALMLGGILLVAAQEAWYSYKFRNSPLGKW